MGEEKENPGIVEFLDLFDELPWHAEGVAPPGSTESIIYRDKTSKTYCRALRLPIGFKGGKEPLHHDFDEVVFVVSGCLVNSYTGRSYGPGSVAVFPRGMAHGPFATPDGAVTLEFRHYVAQN
ncbi:MAG: hypothetical protein IH612_11800 [Desulfofustis sp.]|nr:hypothetical protein [Desulfofustis sp.]